MDKKLSGLPSPTGGKNKGLAIVGANPWSSSDSSDGIVRSESEKTVTADFGAFLNPASDDQEVDSCRANHLQEADSETDTERTEGSSFGQITNNAGNSYHLLEVDSRLRPVKRRKSASLHAERILSGTGRDEARLGYITSPHQRDTNSGTPSWSSGKKLQVKRNMAIPESWKVHPRKDEVDPDGWTIEVRMRNNLKTKDKYYHHKDYNYTFRSRPEVQFFLDSGMVIVNKVPRILPKISADPSVPSSGHGRSCTTRTMTLNSGSGTSASGGKAPASTKLPHGFV